MAPMRRRAARPKGRGAASTLPVTRMDRGVTFTLDFLTELSGDSGVQKATVLSVMQYAIRKGLARRRGRDWYQLLFTGGHAEPSERENTSAKTSGGKSPAQASRAPSITQLSESPDAGDTGKREEPAADEKTQEDSANRGMESYISRLRSSSVGRSENSSNSTGPASDSAADPARPGTRSRAKGSRGRRRLATARP